TLNGPVVETTFSMSPTGPPSTADLGAACIGGTKQHTFTLIATNDGDFELHEVSIALGQEYAVVPRTPKTLPTVNRPFVVEANGANVAEFDIAFTPTREGLAPGAFSIVTDIPQAPPSFDVGLMAFGL